MIFEVDMPSVVNQMMLKEMQVALDRTPYAFISHFEGMSVADLSDLRRKLEKVSRRSIVIKHALARKAFEAYDVRGVEKYFKGNTMITLGDKDPQAISKAIVDFAKANNKFAPTGVVFERQLYDESFVKVLASMPSRHELLTQMVVRMKSPISGFVITLGQLIRGLAIAINEIKKKKESAAGGQ